MIRGRSQYYGECWTGEDKGAWPWDGRQWPRVYGWDSDNHEETFWPRPTTTREELTPVIPIPAGARQFVHALRLETDLQRFVERSLFLELRDEIMAELRAGIQVAPARVQLLNALHYDLHAGKEPYTHVEEYRVIDGRLHVQAGRGAYWFPWAEEIVH